MSQGFVHSVKVPRLYKTTANIIQKVLEDGASLKPLIYEDNKHPNVQAILALASTCLQCASELDRIIRQTEILIKEPRLNPWLARILIAELFWGKKKLSSNAKPVETILRYENQLREALQINGCPEDLPAQKKAYKPRFVRVNTLMMTTKQAIEEFENEGYILVPSGKNYSEYLQGLACLNEWNFIQDFHMPELFAFAPHTQFHNHKAYLSGAIVLQDKASCLPAFFLNPMPGTVVLDLCAAPGMKTTHLAAIMGDRGKIYAAERNGRRYETLRAFVEASKAKSIETLHTDSMTLTPQDCPSVKYILVDPSCSGSGLNRPAADGESKCAPLRLKSLQSFQVMLLRHALLNFPSVKRVVYSTCSIFPEENEMVVDEALRDVRDAYKLLPIRRLLNDNWNNFSSMDYDCKDFCLYVRSEEDFSNGFFVAIFERDFNVALPRYKKKPAKVFENYEEINELNDQDEKIGGWGSVQVKPVDHGCMETMQTFDREEISKKCKNGVEIRSQIGLKEPVVFENNVTSREMTEKNFKSDEIASEINSGALEKIQHDVEMEIPKKKKSKSSKIELIVDPEVSDNFQNEEKPSEKRKKKSKSDKIELIMNSKVSEMPENHEKPSEKKKKTSKSSKNELQSEFEASEVPYNSGKLEKTKKKKSKSSDVESKIDTELSEILQNDEKPSKKKRKKSKSSEIESEFHSDGLESSQNTGELEKTKKKKSKTREIELKVDSEISKVLQTTVELEMSKKKKSKSKEIETEINSAVTEITKNNEMFQEKRRKKSKFIETTSQDNSEISEIAPITNVTQKKKQKSKKNAENEHTIEIVDLEGSEKRRKKRKNTDKSQYENEVAIEEITIDDKPAKKKKKKALAVD